MQDEEQIVCYVQHEAEAGAELELDLGRLWVMLSWTRLDWM